MSVIDVRLRISSEIKKDAEAVFKVESGLPVIQGGLALVLSFNKTVQKKLYSQHN